MCQKLKKYLLLLVFALLFSVQVSGQAMASSPLEYENVDITEFLGSNQGWPNFDPTMNGSAKSTNEWKIEIPSLKDMPIVWQEASTESAKPLTAQQLNLMTTIELWTELDKGLATLDKELLQLQQSVESSKKETESLKKSIEDIKREKEAAEKVIEHLKAALVSNKGDTAEMNQIIGEQFVKIEKLQKDAEDIKKEMTRLRLQETRLKRNEVAVPVCAVFTIVGGFMFGYGLAKDNRTMAYIGLGVAVCPTLVWSAGHWGFRWW